MSRKPASKKSFRLRLGKYETVPSKKPFWCEWKERKEFRDVEFGGVKFRAMYNGYNVVVGDDKVAYDNYGYLKGSPRSYVGQSGSLGLDGNSCAYLKINPRGSTKTELAGFAWWLEHIYLPRGALAYLTKKDGDEKEIKRVLNRRGFRQVCVNKSVHAGNYPVYLLIHPGDAVLDNKKNKGATENADVLGNSNAGVSEPGAAGAVVRGNDEITPVPAAPVFDPGAEVPIPGFIPGFGHDIPAGRVEQDASDGYGNAA